MPKAFIMPASVSIRTFIAIRLKIQTKSSHKIHKSELLRLDFVNLNSWIAIMVSVLTVSSSNHTSLITS